ncbi:MGMT family protein [Paenibacillus segetis]|jgi:methylated-DNA-protein-cysteine methyltransferase-like protein|uniref:6-O-methylguanine DNA methyltransferase n=1 Tax=Paenibacillus segetis TaxID=1325360 RepID=A0ABQ1YS06_9BACL|nr:MGMT family protein [Paenibacillus segetis]GGH34271.1 6-O-methylguanine DNA methyltransferase [Paenibacillus segetis]
MQPFTAKVIEVIAAIPEGKVMTYGGVAREAGSPRAARQVVRILHSMSSKYALPWHRVLNKAGEIAISDDESRFMQRMFLEAEGVEVMEGGRINLDTYQFHPSPSVQGD